MKIILPNEKLLNEFHKKTKLLLNQKENLLKENKTLIKIRETFYQSFYQEKLDYKK